MINLDSDRFLQTEGSDSFNSQETFYTAGTYLGYFLFEAVFGVFFRVILVPIHAMHTFFPNLCIAGERITSKKIEDGYFDSDFQKFKHPILPEGEFKRRMMRIDQIANQMNIKPKVEVYLSLITNESKGMSCSEQIPLLLDAETFSLKEDQFDFTIAQRLSDVSKDHHLYKCLYDLGILITEIACAILFTPFLIPFLEASFSSRKLILQKMMEKDSDLHAISFVGKEGALNLFDSVKAKRLKDRDDEVSKNLPKAGLVRCLYDCFLKFRPFLFTPEGEWRVSTSRTLAERADTITRSPS